MTIGIQRERTAPAAQLLLRCSASLLLLLALAGCQTEIAFSKHQTLNRITCGRVYTLPVPTTNHRRVLWSPDGKQLAYYGETAPGENGIFITDRTGERSINITAAIAAVPTVDFVWSPDSSSILYTARELNGMTTIYKASASGGGGLPVPMTPVGQNSREPSWSPDGERFVYSGDSPEAPGSYDLYTGNADGKGRTWLLGQPSMDESLPAWGVGERLAYVQGPRRGPYSVIVRQLNTSGEHIYRTTYAGYGASPVGDRLVWSSDGERLAFTGGDAKIMVASAKAPYKESCITCTGTNIDSHPAWFPHDHGLVSDRAVNDVPPQNSPHGLFRVDADGSDSEFLDTLGDWPHPRPHRPRLCLF